MVDQVAEDMRDGRYDVAITITRDHLPAVVGNNDHMYQLFANLIGNAVKYRHPERDPVITISVADTEDPDMTTITVADNGTGFDQEFAERIFHPFERLHANNDISGTGMGLAICRRIVSRLGGSILATSAVGKGSAFIVTLPLVPSETPAMQTTQAIS